MFHIHPFEEFSKNMKKILLHLTKCLKINNIILIVDPELNRRWKSLLKNETWCYDSVNIHNYLKQTLGLNIARSSITSHLKNHFNYSFKRVSSRPILADPIRWIILKAIFWAEFGNIMEDRLVYVNVDEVLFTKSTKINYSWGKSGRQIIVSNISFVGSLAMICAITSRGGWFFSPLTSKNNSLVFIEFIKRLINWLTEDQSIKLKDIVILLDNSPIHCSNETMKYLDQIGWTIIFLAPYSPEYAPIELLFHMLKMNLAKHCKGIKVNLSKENGKRAIKEWIALISHSDIISFWIKAMNNVKNSLN